MPYIQISASQYRDLMLIQDRFGIYAQRKAMQRAGLRVAVWRGHEWWHG